MTLDVCVVCLFVITYEGEDPESFGFTAEEWQHSSTALGETEGTWAHVDDAEFFSWSACELCGSTLGGGRHTVGQV
jgi:hypothetical protein